MVFQTLLKAIPGGDKTKVFLGTGLILAACAVPFVGRTNEKKGSHFFSHEKPADVEEKMKIVAPKLLMEEKNHR
ncbi:unnamed protein product [Heterosigma akashiwo]